MASRAMVIPLAAALLAALAAPVVQASFEVDAQGLASHVVDGDTLDVDGVGRIRLADVNAPESGEPGYREAKARLADLVLDRTVYLDVDDVYGQDRYGRTVAVVYVRHNDTSLLNVNEDLLEGHLAVLSDFPNEFNPRDWTLYVDYLGPAAQPNQEPDAGPLGLLTSPVLWAALAVLVVALVALAALVLQGRGR